MQVVQDEVAIDVLPAIIDGICGEVGELQEGFDDKKAGFYAPAFAVYFAEFRPVILLFIEQGGEQDFGFAIGQGNTDKAVGDGSVRWNRDAQHGQCPDGLYLQRFMYDLLIFIAFYECFDRIAEIKPQSNDAI